MKRLFDHLASMFGGAKHPAATPSAAAPDLTLAEAIQAAVGHHQAGRLQEATMIYRQVLAADPHNFDALHLLGVASHQAGDSAKAVELITKAIAIVPSSHSAHSNLGLAYLASNRLVEAEGCLRKALMLKPDWDDAHNNLGMVLQARGDLDDAEACFRKALVLNAGNTGGLNNLANVCKQRGDLDQAEELYRRALALNPNKPEVCRNLGSVYQRTGNLDLAANFYRQALTLKPDYAEAQNDLGTVFQVHGRLEEAEACFHKALDAKGDLAEAFCNLGDVVQALGRLDEAESYCRQALAIRPAYAEALNNLGVIFKKRSNLDEAAVCFKKAIALDPGHAGSHNDLGTIFNERGSLEEAEACFRNALRLNPDSAPAKYNLSIISLLRGDYREGFELYESRFEALAREFRASRGFYEHLKEYRRWRGQDLRGQVLLVWTEQGFGDSLMMMRYLPSLKERGAEKLIVFCQPELKRVMQSIAGVDEVLCKVEVLPSGKLDFGGNFDLHCPIMSLPFLFAARPDRIPNRAPYLRVPEPLKDQWRERLAEVTKEKVGLAWAGSKTLRDDPKRSISLRQFEPLLKIEGIQLVNLQKDEEAKQLQGWGHKIADWMDACDDFMDTAALIENLDLVISVDTAVAHLSGALGKPIWLLNRFGSEWRWGLEGESTPWYPTMRIFRQRESLQWVGVIERTATELEQLLSS